METRIHRSSSSRSRRAAPKKVALVLGLVSLLAVWLAVAGSKRLDVKKIASRITSRFSRLMTLDHVSWEEVGTSNTSSRVTKDLLWKISGLKVGDELMSIDLNDLETRFMAVPWIESVQIQKKIPSDLVVKYTTHHARALGTKKHKLWTISATGKWIAPFERADNALDLPVLTGDGAIDLGLEWLDAFEQEVGAELLLVHEIAVSASKIAGWAEVRYASHPLKVEIIAPIRGRSEVLVRLKRVLQYLIKNNILVSAIDLRPGKKVVVNVGKRP